MSCIERSTRIRNYKAAPPISSNPMPDQEEPNSRVSFSSLTSGLRNSLTSLLDAVTDNFKSKEQLEEEERLRREAEKEKEKENFDSNKSLKRQDTQSAERPKDDVRRANEMLCYECVHVQDEYKRLRGVVEQLDREYENSKDLDIFRRYGMLKGMIKRSVLHLKLCKDEDNQVQPTCGKQKEEMRKREEHLTGLSTEEISSENLTITEQIKEYRRKISMITDLIETMGRNYESSKRYIIVQRYRLMKEIVKTVIHNEWI